MRSSRRFLHIRRRPDESRHASSLSRLERARRDFAAVSLSLGLLLEDEIEAQTRNLCPTATGLDVEIYHDELDEPRARLTLVDSSTPVSEEEEDDITERIGDLLDEWAITAEVERTRIDFRPPAGS